MQNQKSIKIGDKVRYIIKSSPFYNTIGVICYMRCFLCGNIITQCYHDRNSITIILKNVEIFISDKYREISETTDKYFGKYFFYSNEVEIINSLDNERVCKIKN